MKSKLAIFLGAILLLTGCTASNTATIEKPKDNKISSLEELKQAFTNAGGQCWDWMVDNSVPLAKFHWIGKGDCDSRTVLIVYEDGVNVMEEALLIRKTNKSLGFTTSYLIGDNWTVSSDQVEIVYPKMGGTLMTR